MNNSVQCLTRVLGKLLNDDFLLIKIVNKPASLIYCKSIGKFLLSPDKIKITNNQNNPYLKCLAELGLNWTNPPSSLFENSKFPFVEMAHFLKNSGLHADAKLLNEMTFFRGADGTIFERVSGTNICRFVDDFTQGFSPRCGILGAFTTALIACVEAITVDWPTFCLKEKVPINHYDWLRIFKKYRIWPFIFLDDSLKKNFAKHNGFSLPEMHQAEDAFTELMSLRNLDDKILQKAFNIEQSVKGENMTQFEQGLLECDKVRADIEPYDLKILTDPNRGHWELFNKSRNEYIGRNPILDVKESGVVGIDFGTKSTVVVYQDEDIIHPMRVGTGELKKEVSRKDFENPTIIELASFEQFWTQYQEGFRPKTRWEYVKVSHQAELDFFNDTSNDNYSAYFSDLKKWAGNRGKNSIYNLRDKKKKMIALKPYSDLTEDDFDPIEIYAYYLGLYINNMRNGIYLEYYLSFPVSYERPIQEKIIKSFERGLKKSLPQEVVEDKGFAEKFCVHGDVNEPAAYAVCALHEYGFTPDKGQKVTYGIFDFGGGTTDFDFGEWSVSEKRKYDFKITHFGAQGDKYLGGENILELLAYNVFKNNKEKLLKESISFIQPHGCKVFPGSEMLIATSSEAHYNTKNLMNALRRFWENTESDDEKQEFDESGCLKVNLLNTNGNIISSFPLEVKRQEIMDTIRSRIESGVSQFFKAFDSAFFYNGNDETNIDRVYILLAGNSCKSPIVKEVFEEHIAQYEKSAQKENLFKLLPPIGSDSFGEVRESLKNEISITDFNQERSAEEIPTGKTGVAYGLIMSRKGGRIEVENKNVINNDIPFKYYLGYESRGCFQLIKDEEQTMSSAGRINIGIWYEFMEVEEGDCVTEIYFSDIPEAVTNKMSISKVQRIRCRYDAAIEDGFLYVKALDPHTIEYAISTTKKPLEKAKKYSISLDA